MNRVLLIILDGFGEGREYPGNAIYRAKKPTLDGLRKRYPWTLLKASDNAVGVPEGTQGGSEIGHVTLGAGRRVWQPLEKINRAIASGDFFTHQFFVEACSRVKKSTKAALHLIGMISDQGVHSHIEHLFALLRLAKKEQVPKVFIHAIADGRDVPEKSAREFIERIEKFIEFEGLQHIVSLATIIGRFFAMDRDENWDRTKQAYDLYTRGIGSTESNAQEAIAKAYAAGLESDYYLKPIHLDPHGTIQDKDAVIFWNFRTDRTRQLTYCFTGEQKIAFTPEKTVRPYFVCMGPYSEKAPIAFPAAKIANNLGQIIAHYGLKQLRIAETEKYAHVTYFFNSQVDEATANEDRMLIHSPKTPSYADKPEMSAQEITKRLLPILDTHAYDFILLNFANTDLVAHSGHLDATIKAVEVVDSCLAEILKHAHGYTILITGDHGNAEFMIYDNGEPCPSHTTNPVPFIVVSETQAVALKNPKKLGGELSDVAPTVLQLLGIEKPVEMTGESLLK